MRIVGVHVTGYRSLASIEIPVSRFTVLLGPNGSGKSSILEALGHLPYVEGEEERAEDRPENVTWCLEPTAEEWNALAPDWDWSSDWIEPLRPWCGNEPAALFLVCSIGRAATLSIRESPGAQTADRAARRQAAERLLRTVPAEMPEPFAGFDDLITVAELGHESSLLIPRATTVFADADDISPTLVACVRTLAERSWAGVADADAVRGAALEALVEDHRLSLADAVGLVAPIVAALQARSEGLLPEFVSQQGDLLIQLIAGPDSTGGNAMLVIDELVEMLESGDFSADLVHLAKRARVAIEEHEDPLDAHLDVVIREPRADGQGAVLVPFSRLGRATRRWIAASVHEAARLLLDELPEPRTIAAVDLVQYVERGALPERTDLPLVQPPRLYLVDEPGESLHPTVQQEALFWLSRRLGDHDAVVLTSHTPLILKSLRHRDDLTVVGVHRRAPNTEAVAVHGGLVGELEQSREILGLESDELLLLARALLLVEGADDVAVLHALYGAELAREGIVVHAVGGSDARALRTFVGGDLVRRLRLPIRILVDKTEDRLLPPEWRLTRKAPTPEQRATTEFLAWAAGENIADVAIVPFEADDILCGIGESVIQRTFAEHLRPDFRPWQVEHQTFETWRTAGHPGTNLKNWFMTRRLGLPPNEFQAALRALLAEAHGPEHASLWLRSSMQSLLTNL